MIRPTDGIDGNDQPTYLAYPCQFFYPEPYLAHMFNDLSRQDNVICVARGWERILRCGGVGKPKNVLPNTRVSQVIEPSATSEQ